MKKRTEITARLIPTLTRQVDLRFIAVGPDYTTSGDVAANQSSLVQYHCGIADRGAAAEVPRWQRLACPTLQVL